MKRLVKGAAIAAGAAALGLAVERMIVAAPRYGGPESDHFDGRRFHNADPRRQLEGSFLKWQLTRERGGWREWVDAKPGLVPPGRVDGGRVRVTFVNHATLLVQMDGVNLLTDPIWSLRCSPLPLAGPKRHRPPGIRFQDLPPVDAVLVSHNHYDHLDVPTLRALNAPRIITPLGNARLMARYGIERAMELDWWQASKVSERVTVTLVPAQHFCARGLSDRDTNLWGGFMISGPSGNVYFAGDTGWGTHFAQIAKRFPNVRVALLPIGAYLPRWFMKPAHVDPAEAVEAHKVLRAQTSIPMHYGTFALGDDGETRPLDDLRLAIAAAGNPNFRILDFGEGDDFP
ncbi:MAG TPA: MBL fold metallo-hydrolase [Thermoanaerobaculia bacterium]|jgi:L-ascorbate metabolism protein UlaG (beta-lactamase superfamily)|nr:MBL fold metallo-hydrolase [Thermoanaerobaculia bacterium]